MRTVGQEFQSLVDSFEFSLSSWGGDPVLARLLIKSSKERVKKLAMKFHQANTPYSPLDIRATQQMDVIYQDYLTKRGL